MKSIYLKFNISFQVISKVLPCLFLYFTNCIVGTNLVLAQSLSNIFFCGFNTDLPAKNLCDVNVFTGQDNSSVEFEHEVKRILYQVDQHQNFIVKHCNSLINPMALTNPKGLRYILYNWDSIKDIRPVYPNWVKWGVLAHAVGHHIRNHSIRRYSTKESFRENELEADEFSGFILAKLGATRKEALACTALLDENEDELISNFPSKVNRTQALERGYDLAVANRKFNSLKPKSPRPDNMEYYLNRPLRSDSYDVQFNIRTYKVALEFDPNCKEAYYGMAYEHMKIFEHEIDFSPRIDKLPLIQNVISNLTSGIKYDNVPFNLAESYAQRSKYNFLLSEKTKALEDVSKAIDYFQHAKYYLARGNIKLNMKDTLEADEDYSKAIQLYKVSIENKKQDGHSSSNFQSYAGLAASYFQLRKYDDAFKLYDQIIKHFPQNGVGYELMAQYEFLIKKDRAKSCVLAKKACILKVCSFYYTYCSN